MGTTDSEVLFFRLLTAMADAGVLDTKAGQVGPEALWESISSVVERVAELTGGTHDDTNGPSGQTFVLTDGNTLIGHKGGKPLFVHAPAIRHGDQERSWAVERGATDHFRLASEPVPNSEVWSPIRHGGAVGVSLDMTVWVSPNALAD